MTWLVRYSAASTTKLSKNCLWAASWSKISFSLQKKKGRKSISKRWAPFGNASQHPGVRVAQTLGLRLGADSRHCRKFSPPGLQSTFSPPKCLPPESQLATYLWTMVFTRFCVSDLLTFSLELLKRGKIFAQSIPPECAAILLPLGLIFHCDRRGVSLHRARLLVKVAKFRTIWQPGR